MPNKRSEIKKRICKWCGKPIEPPYSNNRQNTHEDTETTSCRTEYHRLLRRNWDKANHKSYNSTLTAAEKANRGLARSGFDVDLTGTPDPKKVAALIRAGDKYMANLSRLRKNRDVKAEAERVARLPQARSCIGAGPGPHELVEYHVYQDKNGANWSASWILDTNSTHTMVCNLYDETGRNSVQFRPYSMKLQLSCDAFGLKPAGKSLVADLNIPDHTASTSEVFDLDSFLKYYNWIGCWVDESREEHNMKEKQIEYEKSRWLWDAEKYEDVTPRLKNTAIKRRRDIVCRGYRGKTCSGSPMCHLTLTQERLEEQSWKVRYFEKHQ